MHADAWRLTLACVRPCQVVRFCKDKDIGLVVVGPEVPLVAGLADDLEAAGIPTWGPSAKAAQLEGSKAFMKDILKKYNIPTAAYEKFTDPQRAKDFIRSLGAPIVVKASGLAAGKGVVVATTIEEAYKAVDDMLVNKVFGNAGARKEGQLGWSRVRSDQRVVSAG